MSIKLIDVKDEMPRRHQFVATYDGNKLTGGVIFDGRDFIDCLTSNVITDHVTHWTDNNLNKKGLDK